MTATRDYLYRSLYLRREMLILTSQCTQHAEADGESASSSAIDLRDILLLPPLYGLEGLSAPPPPLSNAEEEGTAADPMLTLDHAWTGLVQVRGAASPWYRGCFSFYVYFPSRYPFEPPIIELTGPLRSHPLVQERRVLQLDQLSAAAAAAGAADPPSAPSSRAAPLSSAVTNASTAASSLSGKRAFIPFEETYAAIDPMRVSVMAVLLRHVLRVFYPAEWPAAWEAATINRVLARRDVERRSVTQEVMLSRPFEQYVGADVMEHFVEMWESAKAARSGDVTGSAVGDGADWYTREVLPHLLHS